MDHPEFSILYVDDEPHNLTTLKATFRRKYPISTAKGGEEGLAFMRQKSIHLVISDQRMPGMTGVEFLEQVAREFPDVIRIILTGFSDVEAIINAINSGGIFRYITKPWSETELIMTIENARQLYNIQSSNQHLVQELQSKVVEQEKILRLFSRYVPEAVVQKALQDAGGSIFEGEIAEVVVLFCDIRGFTSLSENLPPKEVVGILNDYYSLMTDCVQRHHGSVCQFVGDEVFAAFGAPVDYPNNEENAVYCAMDMISKLDSLNEKYRSKLNGDLVVGIAVHSGEAITGNVGSEERINYAVTGATVNNGRRIENLTKEDPNIILISEPVQRKVEQLVKLREWGSMEIRSRSEALKLFEVTGDR